MTYFFDSFELFKKHAEGKKIFIFLDYDGTLTPIVSSPDKAVFPPKTKALLNSVSGIPGVKVAVISGRALSDLKSKVGIKNIIYAGNHGLEIQGPKIKFTSFLPVQYQKALVPLRNSLAKKLEGIKGVIIEDKVLTISVHYRMVEPRNVPLVKTIFHEAAILYVVKGLVTIHQGKKTLEIRPSFNWDKGKIVLWLLAREQFLNSGDTVIPVYIGDDTTDEDAFRVLRKEGFTIFVGKPAKTLAEYYLKDPGDVNVFLDRVIRMSGKERP